MAFTDYTPGPVPGSYNFLDRETGAVTLSYGPEAEAFKRRLDMQKDMRVAGGGFGGEGPNMSIAEPNMSVAPPAQNMSVAPPQEQAPSPAAPVKPVMVPWRTNDKGNVLHKVIDPATGKELSDPQEYRPGSRGVSQADNKKLATSGTAVPAGARDTVEGGYDKDQAYLDQLKATAEAREQSAVQVAAAETRALEAEQGVFRNRKLLAAVEQDIEKNKAAEIAQRVARDREAYDGAIEAVRGKKVDANRLFSGAGGNIRLLAVSIGQALSGYSDRMLGRQGNSWQIVQAAIDRDIAEQEHEIASGNKNVDNALARLTRSTGDINQAKLLLKQLQNEHALAEAEEIGSKAKSDIVSAKIDQVRADIQLGYQTTREEYERLAAGKHTAQVEAKYVYPKAGSAGGFRPISLKDAGTITENKSKNLGLRETEAKIENTEASSDKLRAEAKGGGKPLSAAQEAALSRRVKAKQGMNNAMNALGIVWDENTKSIKKTKEDIPGVGLIDQYTANIPGTKNAEARQTADRMLIAQILEASGLVATENEVERHHKSLYGSGTEGGYLNGLRNIILEARASEKALRTGEEPDMVTEDTQELPEPGELTR